MNKILSNILAAILVIGIASAAMYVATNPHGILIFDRDSPGEPGLPVSTTIALTDGTTGYAQTVDMGTVPINVIQKKAMFSNTGAFPFDGIVYIEIECEEGLQAHQLGGIEDFETIYFVDPAGVEYQCDNMSYVTVLSPTTVRIETPMDIYTFEPGGMSEDYATLIMNLKGNAYGHYTVDVFVDTYDAY